MDRRTARCLPEAPLPAAALGQRASCRKRPADTPRRHSRITAPAPRTLSGSGVLAAIELGPSNGRLEALNSKLRWLSHRAYGFHFADALIAMIYLCCVGIQIALPQR
jgi:Transposase